MLTRIRRAALRFSTHHKTQLSARQQCDMQQVLTNILDAHLLSPEKLNLLTYLVCRINPSTLTFREKLCAYVVAEQFTTNSDVERALKVLKKQALSGLTLHTMDWVHFESEFFGVHLKSQLIQEIESLATTNNFNDSNYCKHALRALSSRYPSIPTREIFTTFNEIRVALSSQQDTTSTNQSQSYTGEQIYEKIAQFDARDLASAINTKSHVDAHLAVTGGRVRLRFPPEPNGYLHLGHVRSIWLNFHSAHKLGGLCYLRYDDTNPSSERQSFIDQIAANVAWFGYVPSCVTYASDYFEQLFECAVRLIRDDKAYVCEQNKEELSEERRLKLASPYRGRNWEDSLRLFHEMKAGRHEESRYVLRLKIDPQHCNPTLRDPIIYRVKFEAHPRTGTEWRIYPMYDFAHCICDSLENITHSLCTLEFEIRRELYYWILSALQMYKPVVYEFSRLNVSHGVLSKRKIAQLVERGCVEGWDDPRLLTLAGLRRRGYTPSSLLAFIELVNVSRSGNENITQFSQLEGCIRKEMDESAPRLMAILQPITLELTNLPDEMVGASMSLAWHPKQSPQRTITIHRQLYLERADFRLLDDDNYYGLAPNKEVVLKYFAVIRWESHELDAQGQVTLVRASVVSFDPEHRRKIKGQLHWLSVPDAMDCEVREYSQLLTTDDPTSNNPLEHLSPNSLSVLHDAKIPRSFDYQANPRVQFERQGYYCLDDAPHHHQHLVFNKVVGLREAKTKHSGNK